MAYSIENPWIKERETTLCMWKTDYNRGFINNMSTSLMVDFMSYSNRQIGEYVKMIKSCGFTGMQITDICTAWRYSGSWESVHDRFKVLADALHANGMNLTVWVWAAEFCGHGWYDEEVTYSPAGEGQIAYDNPKVFDVFNKYYDIYADLAPYADRVIAHYYDPGNLPDVESVVKFAQLLFGKFRAKNPSVKLGIDTWGADESFPRRLIEAGFSDVMLMELPFLPTWGQPGFREKFRQGVKDLGCALGSWGWYTCEYEIDQEAMLNVNSRVIADVFNRTREQGDHVMIPSYWSEIDSYHVLNYFSLYCAGHLMINPDADPDQLLAEAAEKVAGNDHAEELLYVLELIRDARSGDTWESYWWTSGENHIFETADHAALLVRAEKAIQILEGLIADADNHGDAPLPISVKSVYRLILPHLHQIRQFDQFMIGFRELEEMKENGASAEEMQKKADSLPFRIPEYNCIIGLWGQPEANFAYKKLHSFCEANGLETPDLGAQKFILKKHFYEHLAAIQFGKSKPVCVGSTFYENGMAFGTDLTLKLVMEMVADGTFIRDESKSLIHLANWESFKFDFNN